MIIKKDLAAISQGDSFTLYQFKQKERTRKMRLKMSSLSLLEETKTDIKDR
jgi:hypothetical protein